MYARFWQNLDSITCLLGGLEMSTLLMYVRFGQSLVSFTCLLGSLTGLDFAYVRTVSAFVEGPKRYVHKVSVSL